MDKEVFISGRKHKAASKLQRIFSQAVLLVSSGLGATARLHVVSTQQMQQGSVAQAYRFIGHAFVIDQKREVDAGFLAEEAGVACIAQADHGQMSAFSFELFFEFAQLRDVLAAEDSTVVAKKHQHGWSALPQ